MKVKVISVFRDKFTSQLYHPGDFLTSSLFFAIT